ncbi:MAG: hypothetical protein K0U20_08945 [Proteobacteria bacterium]|nr:hypothetical protein [Pseudomonadota bacterium]
MNKNIIVAVVVGVVILLLMGASGFAGYKWKAAQYAETVAALNATIYEQGVKLQNKINDEAEANRKLKIANRGRINAIKINDHNTETIKQLQRDLDLSVSELDIVRNDRNRLVVLNVSSVNRVYDEARNQCDGLARSSDPAIIPTQLHEFTGDSVAGVVRYLVARYCEVATDYNGLYEHTEGLLTGIKKPAQ